MKRTQHYLDEAREQLVVSMLVSWSLNLYVWRKMHWVKLQGILVRMICSARFLVHFVLESNQTKIKKHS
jgi:hypothetical protein